MKLSVIICTHNPKPHYLDRVLQALREQTLENTEWELLLIDNASKEPLAHSFDLSWHPKGRHLLEENLGVAPARARGIAETTSDLLVFVDDDTVLSREYLEITLKISDRHPVIGSWGGQIIPEFEKTPEPWMEPFLELLTIHIFDKDRWSNIPETVMPCTSGMCLRRAVALRYLQDLERWPQRKILIKRGEDMDMDLTAFDMGYGTGQFTDLKLTHLIGKERVSEDYLVRIHEAARYSMRILMALRGKWRPGPKSNPLLRRWRLWRYDRIFEPHARRIVQACRLGEEKAEAFIMQHPEDFERCR